MHVNRENHYDILLDGGYFCDLVFTGLPEFPRLGHEIYSREFNLVPGGAFTSAVALRRLGLNVAWPCMFGSDPFSQFIKSRVLQEGLDPSFFTDSSQPSLRITVAFSFENERAFLSYSDPVTELPFIELVKDLKPAWLYISHLDRGEKFEKLVAVARASGTKIYMDCQAHNQNINNSQIASALRMVDVFSPNAEEAKQITGKEDVEKALAELASLVPLVIIKLGKKGCICQWEGKILRMPGIQVKVVDTTGAGDNFNCGFLLGQVRGYSLQKSLRIGNICGGLSTRDYGGTSTSIDFEKVKQYLDKDELTG